MKRFLFALMGIIISLPSWAGGCSCVVLSNPSRLVVTFDVNSYEMCDCAEDSIDSFLGNCTDVVLVGSADAQGNTDYNTDLSNKRLQAVKDVLPDECKSFDFIMGEAAASFYGMVDSPDFRSVTIIPVNSAELELYKLQTQLLTATQDMWGNVSVWKNAEGKFNTARLASDSIAGVVLGTVGGVVTSTVVKKNQVKNGFEDIKCVIGGQMVASWGDQINVGLQ